MNEMNENITNVSSSNWIATLKTVYSFESDAEFGRLALSPFLLPKRDRNAEMAAVCFEEQKELLKAYTDALRGAKNAAEAKEKVSKRIGDYIRNRNENIGINVPESKDYRYIGKGDNFKPNYIADFFCRSSDAYDCYNAYSTFATELIEHLYSNVELNEKNAAARKQLSIIPRERYSEAEAEKLTGMLFTDLLLLSAYGETKLKREYKAEINKILQLPDLSAKEKIDIATGKYLKEILTLANDYDSICSVFSILKLFAHPDVDDLFAELNTKTQSLRDAVAEKQCNAIKKDNYQEAEDYIKLVQKLNEIRTEIEKERRRKS